MDFFLLINFMLFVLLMYISIVHTKKHKEYLIRVFEIEIPCKEYLEKINKKIEEFKI